MYLMPLAFVASQVWMLSQLTRCDYCLAIRIHGEIMPMDVDFSNVILWVVLPIGFLLFIMSWMVISDWVDKKTFKELLDIQTEQDS